MRLGYNQWVGSKFVIGVLRGSNGKIFIPLSLIHLLKVPKKVALKVRDCLTAENFYVMLHIKDFASKIMLSKNSHMRRYLYQDI